MTAQELCRGVLDGATKVSDLSNAEQEMVIEYLTECAESYLDTEYDDMAHELLELLEAINVLKQEKTFADAIAEAEKRGSTFWEIENPSIQ